MSSPNSVNAHRNRLELTYWVTAIVCFCVLSGICFKVAISVPEKYGKNFDIWALYVSLFVFGGWANWLAIRVCRYFKLSLEREDVLVFTRVEGSDVSTSIPLEKVQANRSTKSYVFFGVVALFSVALAQDSFSSREVGPVRLATAALSVILLGIFLLACKNIRKPLLLLNEEGLQSSDDLGLEASSANWDDIDSCEWVRNYDVFGRRQNSLLRVRNVQQKVLFTIRTENFNASQHVAFEKILEYLSLKYNGEPLPPDLFSTTEVLKKYSQAKDTIVQTTERAPNSNLHVPLGHAPPKLASAPPGAALVINTLIICIGLAFLGPVYDHDRFEWREHIALCMVSAIIVLVGIVNLFRSNRPQVKADDNGIEYSDAFGNVKFIFWKDIHFCDFVTIQKSLGTPNIEYVVLRDSQGSKIVQLKLSSGDRMKDDLARKRLAEHLAYQLATPSSLPPADRPATNQ